MALPQPETKNHELHEVENDADEGQHQEHEVGEEIWLLSYSDMMTLLFGFFVLMYALSKSTTSQQQAVKEAISKTIAGSYSSPDEKLAEELKKLVKKASESEMYGQIEITQPKDGLEITFRSNILFPSGNAELIPQMQDTMKLLIGIISKNVNNAEIMVAGHTDDVPIHTPKFPSNWELSTARAATVVKAFESNGYPSHLLVAMGYGSSRPTLPNRDENNQGIIANQEKNRRVVIKVVSPQVNKQPTNAPRDPKADNIKNPRVPTQDNSKPNQPQSYWQQTEKPGHGPEPSLCA